MSPRPWQLVLVLALAGCQPQIGDHCVVSTDCSTRGDRLCDTSQPNGYCTAFNCVGDDCPSGSACILFGGSVAGCPIDDRRAPPRTGRSMCLYSCQTDSDCRTSEGYVCADPRSAPYSATALADGAGKVCLVKLVADAGAPYSMADAEAPVCKAGGATVPDIDAAAAPDASDASVAVDAGAGDAALDAADAAD